MLLRLRLFRRAFGPPILPRLRLATLAWVLPAGVSVFAAPQRALLNLSTRVMVGTSGDRPTCTFIVEGTAPKIVLVRAVGPSLATAGVSGALADPSLTVYDGTGTLVASNDNWGGNASLKAAATAVGAFPLSSDTSRDAAVLISVNPGVYSVQVSGVGNTTGLAQVEVFDTENTPRLPYLAIQGTAGAGSTSALNATFTISGSTQTVLIRALGNTLASFGYTGALQNPTLTVLNGSSVVGTNSKWGGTTAIANAAASAGLWTLPNNSNDAALLLTLPAGTYTAAVSSNGNGSGVVLLEIAQIDNDRAAAFVPMFNEPPVLRTPAAFATQSVAIRSNISFRIPNYLAKPSTVTFQWKKNGVNLTGATSAGLTLNNVQTTDSGNYTVALTNSAGTTVSATTTLLVTNSGTTPPRLSNLSALTFVSGSDNLTANFIIEGTSAKPVVIRGAGPSLSALGVSGFLNNPLLTIYDGTGTKIYENDDWGGTAALKTAFTAVGAFPFADSGKDSALLVTLNPGAYSASISGVSGASGNALLEIFDTETPAAVSRIAYLASRGQLSAAGTTGIGIGGTGTSGNSSLLVRALGPTLASAGIPRAATDPALAFFSGSTQMGANDNWGGVTNLSDAATTAGLTPLLSGSTDSALLMNVAGGAYTTRVSPASGIAMVEIAQIDAARAASFAPALLVPPAPIAVKLGESTTLSALAIGKPAPTFQWRKNGTAIPGATASAFTLGNFQAADAGSYSVVLTNPAGTTLSANYAVALNPIAAPAITGQPVAQDVAAGGTATFSVAVSGNPTPVYQWLFNGVALPGATNPSLTLANVQDANTGAYSVRVTNSEGSVTSAAAALTIAILPKIIANPTPQKVAAGNPATMRVVAAIPTPVTYQWLKDGKDIPGATNANHTIDSVQPANAGNYSVVVKNNAGSTMSTAAALTVTLSYAGTYFGTFSGGLGEWALIVHKDNTGNFIARLDSPKGAVVEKVTVGDDGTFRTPTTLLQAASTPQSIGGHPVAAAAINFTLTGAIGTTTVTGTLEGLGVTYSGALDPGSSTTASGALYVSTSGATTTYTVVGPHQVLALTVGTTSVDGGLGTVATNGTFTVNTPGNTVVSGTVNTTTGTITTTVTSPSGPPVSSTGSVTGGLGPPTITRAPAPVTVTVGSPAAFAVTAGGRTPMTYQWQKNGAAIPGATDVEFAIAFAQLEDAGIYTCQITNGDGNITTLAAGLTVLGSNATFPTARLINLSIRTELRTAGESFMMGYVVGGRGTAGPASLVVRAVGPSLAALGITGALDDPKVELFAGPAKIDENDNWGGTPELNAAFASVGAFSYAGAASKDAALLANVGTRDNSVRISAAGEKTGEVVAELYAAGAPDPASPRLVNVSVLKHLGSGLTAGFVIGGTGTTNVLIRAIGPTLATDFNIANAVANPQLTLLSGQTVLTSNDDWGGSPEMAAVFNTVGAFPLAAGSRDAALLVTLQRGAYTVRVSGVAETTGVAIVEIYEVP